jgi:hypothetical protein
MLFPALEGELRNGRLALDGAASGNIIELCRQYLAPIAAYRAGIASRTTLYSRFCAPRLLTAIRATESSNTESRMITACVGFIRLPKTKTADELMTSMVPATIKSRPVTRFTAYQIFSSDKVFSVRHPYQKLGGTRPRSSGTPRPMRTNPTVVKRSVAVAISLI